jgi:hypothetical protein
VAANLRSKFSEVSKVHTLPKLHSFKLLHFRISLFSKGTKIWLKFFKHVSNFSVWRKLVQWVDRGRVLLGDDTGYVAIMLLPIRFSCVGIWISNCDLRNSDLHNRPLVSDVLKNNNYLIRGVCIALSVHDTSLAGVCLPVHPSFNFKHSTDFYKTRYYYYYY